MTITNDGATILKEMQVLHPAAKMVSLPLCSEKRTAFSNHDAEVIVFVVTGNCPAVMVSGENVLLSWMLSCSSNLAAIGIG